MNNKKINNKEEFTLCLAGKDRKYCFKPQKNITAYDLSGCISFVLLGCIPKFDNIDDYIDIQYNYLGDNVKRNFVIKKNDE